jgi:PAS domain S-box-containing protein
MAAFNELRNMTFQPFSPIPLDHETYVPEGDGRMARRYLIAVVAVAVAMLARLTYQELLDGPIGYTLFMPAVLVAAGYGGFGPGFVALSLSGLLGNYFSQRHYGEFELADTAEGVRLALSLLAGLLICVMGGQLQGTRRRAVADAKELLRQSERFRASDENYRRMFETAYEGICCLDEQGQVIYVNGRMVNMLGYSIIGMVGHPASDFVFPEDRQRLQSTLDGRRQGVKDVFDFRFRRKDGRAIFCIVSTQSTFDREGRYRGSLNMITDITARHWSAEDVNQLLDLLKAQVQALQDLQHSALARLPPSVVDAPDVLADGGGLDDVRQTIARSIGLTEQITLLLRTGKMDEADPAYRLRAAESS